MILSEKKCTTIFSLRRLSEFYFIFHVFIFIPSDIFITIVSYILIYAYVLVRVRPEGLRSLKILENVRNIRSALYSFYIRCVTLYPTPRKKRFYFVPPLFLYFILFYLYFWQIQCNFPPVLIHTVCV